MVCFVNHIYFFINPMFVWLKLWRFNVAFAIEKGKWFWSCLNDEVFIWHCKEQSMLFIKTVDATHKKLMYDMKSDK